MADVLPFSASNREPLSDDALLVDAKRLARLMCCGVRTIRTHDAAGKLPQPLRIGGRVVWRLEEIKDWLAAGAPPRDEWKARKDAMK